MHTKTISVTTSWVSLPDLLAGQVNILNRTGADLQVRYARETGAGDLVTLPDGAPAVLRVLSSASEIQIKAVAEASGVNLILAPL